MTYAGWCVVKPNQTKPNQIMHQRRRKYSSFIEPNKIVEKWILEAISGNPKEIISMY